MKTTTENLLRGTRKAAAYLGVSTNTFLKLVKAGKIPFMQILSNRYFDPAALDTIKAAAHIFENDNAATERKEEVEQRKVHKVNDAELVDFVIKSKDGKNIINGEALLHFCKNKEDNSFAIALLPYNPVKIHYDNTHSPFDEHEIEGQPI